MAEVTSSAFLKSALHESFLFIDFALAAAAVVVAVRTLVSRIDGRD